MPYMTNQLPKSERHMIEWKQAGNPKPTLGNTGYPAGNSNLHRKKVKQWATNQSAKTHHDTPTP